MNIRKLLITDIYVDPDRYTDPAWGLDKETVSKLVQSIKQTGTSKPIIVREITGKVFHECRYELGPGLHTLEAHKRLGRKNIDADVVDLDDERWEKLLILENFARRKPTYWEEGEMVNKLMEIAARDNPAVLRPGPTPKSDKKDLDSVMPTVTPVVEMAKQIGISKETLYQSLTIARDIPAPLKEKLKELDLPKKFVLSVAKSSNEKKEEMQRDWDRWEPKLSSTKRNFAKFSHLLFPPPEKPEKKPPLPESIAEEEDMWAAFGDSKLAKKMRAMTHELKGTHAMPVTIILNTAKGGRDLHLRLMNYYDPISEAEKKWAELYKEKHPDCEFHFFSFEDNDDEGKIYIDGKPMPKGSLGPFLRGTSRSA